MSARLRAWGRPPLDHAWFVRAHEDQVAAVQVSVDADGWLQEFDTAFAVIAGRFSRVEPRKNARGFLLGLLSDVDTRSCWQLAEQARDRTPHRMQRLLGGHAPTPTPCGTTCAATSPTSWVTQLRC